MSEPDATLQRIGAILDRMEAHFDRIDALLQEILDLLDARHQDAPPHQRGFRRHGRGRAMRAPLLGVPGPADALHGKVVPPAAAARIAEWAAAG